VCPAVIISKFLYAIGCTIAYVVVLKKNIPTGLSHVVNCPNSPPSLSVCAFIASETYFTFTLCTIIILPLSLHRKLDKLAKFSGISIVAVLCIAAIIIYQYAVPSTGSDFTSISKDLLEIRAGYIQVRRGRRTHGGPWSERISASNCARKTSWRMAAARALPALTA